MGGALCSYLMLKGDFQAFCACPHSLITGLGLTQEGHLFGVNIFIAKCVDQLISMCLASCLHIAIEGTAKNNVK